VKTIELLVTPPLPSPAQVLWRSGCPPGEAGSEVENSVRKAIETLAKISSEAVCGVLLFNPGERPGFLQGIWPEKMLTVMIVSLGEKVDALLNGPAALNQFMLDSAASVAVESYMKVLQASVAVYLNMLPTKRIAPGYGDFPLSAQKNIIDLFPGSGITCNESFMLAPVKSMTGVTGWIPHKS
jgi:hypothetical protein